MKTEPAMLRFFLVRSEETEYWELNNLKSLRSQYCCESANPVPRPKRRRKPKNAAPSTPEWNDIDDAALAPPIVVTPPDHVYSIHMCSPDLGVHICEFTPSTELHYVETYAVWDAPPTNDAEEELRQAVYEEVADEGNSSSNLVDYVHRSDVLHRWCPGLSEWLDENPEPEDHYRHESGTWCYIGSAMSDDEDAIEGLREYVQCNSLL